MSKNYYEKNPSFELSLVQLCNSVVPLYSTANCMLAAFLSIGSSNVSNFMQEYQEIVLFPFLKPSLLKNDPILVK